MDVLYADEIFLKNALLDAALLIVSARMLGSRPRPGRLMAAAGVGGVYAFLAALPPLYPLRSMPAALVVSLGMARILFGRGRALWRGWGAFLLLSALAAGAVMAVGAGLLLPIFGLGAAVSRLLLPRLPGRRQIMPVTIALGERRVTLAALRDTGNSLRDPITGAGVLIADSDALAPLFPFPLPSPLPEAPELFRRLSEKDALRGRLSLVPYSAVGTDRGLLLCLRPDSAEAEGLGRELLVALSPTRVGSGEYNAVIP